MPEKTVDDNTDQLTRAKQRLLECDWLQQHAQKQPLTTLLLAFSAGYIVGSSPRLRRILFRAIKLAPLLR